MLFIGVAYLAAALLLSLYSLQAFVFSILSLRRSPEAVPPMPETWPTVTVQLPVFNEMHVACRLVDAVAALDYPRQRLHIQVLDDSTDETTALLAATVRRLQARGVRIEHRHRAERSGFKAGALAAALPDAGEFIAIFDADFVPPADFLHRTMPYLVADPTVGFLQARWDHLNADYSALTRAQAMALDGHFVVEQHARQRLGAFIGFNGTAGVWRKACIESSGGWQADTLCEDMDLSYRAQLAGWSARFCGDIAVPAEIPPQLEAYKRQQYRWAKGSTQCLRKHGWAVLRSERSLLARLCGLLHLSGYLVHPLMLLVVLLSIPMLWWGDMHRLPVVYLIVSSLGPPFLLTLGQFILHRHQPRRWLRRMTAYPLLMLIGLGFTLNCTRAVLEGWAGKGGTFRRTPKFHVQARADAWTSSPYALGIDRSIMGEMLLALYGVLAAGLAAYRQQLGIAPYFALYALAFAAVVLISAWQARIVRVRPRRVSAPRVVEPAEVGAHPHRGMRRSDTPG